MEKYLSISSSRKPRLAASPEMTELTHTSTFSDLTLAAKVMYGRRFPCFLLSQTWWLHFTLKQGWGREDAPTRILAMHGWMDNAATWDHVAPLLVASSGCFRTACTITISLINSLLFACRRPVGSN